MGLIVVFATSCAEIVMPLALGVDGFVIPSLAFAVMELALWAQKPVHRVLLIAEPAAAMELVSLFMEKLATAALTVKYVSLLQPAHLDLAAVAAVKSLRLATAADGLTEYA